LKGLVIDKASTNFKMDAFETFLKAFSSVAMSQIALARSISLHRTIGRSRCRLQVVEDGRRILGGRVMRQAMPDELLVSI
jgi:hypothetical protein